MKNNRINLRLLCALSLILLVSNGLQAMTEKVKKNVEKLRETNSCKKCNLQWVSIPMGELQGANLRGANLYRAFLWGTDLSGADLKGANLRKVNLEEADLKGANLTEANLTEANLRKVNLKGANLRRVLLTNPSQLKGANLIGANLDEVKQVNSITDEEVINSGAKLNKNTTLPSGKKYSK